MGNEFKEVWYVWDGEGVTPKVFSGVLYASNLKNGTGGYTSPILGGLEYYQSYFDFRNDRTANAVAYTNGEMRRRVECGACQGKEKWKENYWFTRRCTECNGTGKVWEYKK